MLNHLGGRTRRVLATSVTAAVIGAGGPNLSSIKAVPVTPQSTANILAGQTTTSSPLPTIAPQALQAVSATTQNRNRGDKPEYPLIKEGMKINRGELSGSNRIPGIHTSYIGSTRNSIQHSLSDSNNSAATSPTRACGTGRSSKSPKHFKPGRPQTPPSIEEYLTETSEGIAALEPKIKIDPDILANLNSQNIRVYLATS